MAANTKPLTYPELSFVESHYSFERSGDSILVKANKRTTEHPASKAFSLLLPLERRRITLTQKAISAWTSDFGGRYSLIEVQNALSLLESMALKPSHCMLKAQLKKQRSALDNMKGNR